MPLTSSMEDYLEAVLVLQQQKGYVRCVDVAELLDVKKPSVSRAVKELSKKKCLIKKDDGTLSLTEQGQQIAQQIYEKVWGEALTINERGTIGYHVRNLRKKLYSADPHHPFIIESVREVGYRFQTTS